MTTLHTFAVCAYKESEYLEECIQSLINHDYKSKIIIATSTPNDYIDSLAKKYDIPVYVNEGEGGITQDWNFALSKVDTKLGRIFQRKRATSSMFQSLLCITEYMRNQQQPKPWRVVDE